MLEEIETKNLRLSSTKVQSLFYGLFDIKDFNMITNWRWHFYLKLEQGWIIQWPIAFCRTRSFMRAFFEPNNFIANLLSVGAKIFWSWFLTQPGFDSHETEFLEKEKIELLSYFILFMSIRVYPPLLTMRNILF